MDMLKRQSGFSLLEVMIALVILAVALLALAGLMTTSTAYNASGSRVTEASIIAQDTLEILRGSQWSDISNDHPENDKDVIGANGIHYHVLFNVNQVPNPVPPPDNILRVVTITITWTENIDHTLTFGPYTITRPPGQ